MSARLPLALLYLTHAGIAFAGGEPAAADPFGDVEQIEELADEDFTDIATLDSPARPTGVVALLGYFHAALVHLPIAWVLLLLLVDVATFFGERPWHRAGWLLSLLAAASFVPAVGTGIVRAQGLGIPAAEMGDVLLHRNVMLATFAMLLVAVAIRWRAGTAPTGAARHAYLGFVVVTAALLTYGGHLGGTLVYGPLPW